MAVDYLSTLNSNGSGLNITQLVDSIVDAETIPKRQLITDKQSQLDLSISELGQLKSNLEVFNSNLTDAYTGQTLIANSSGTAVGIVMDDPWVARPETLSIKVDSLASAQLMEFTGFTSPDDLIDTGTLTVDFGTWDANSFTARADGLSHDLLIESGANTLAEVAAALNDLDGVSARVLDKGDGTYSLSLRSETGAQNALRLSGITALETTDQSHELLAASDASLRVDGITITRGSNEITDLIPGATVTLNSMNLYPDTVGLTVDADRAELELSTFVDQLNAVSTILKTATQRGGNGNIAGALVGDPTANALRRSLSSLTTQPIMGFGPDPIYLSQLGVQTGRDGSLSLDTDQFRDSFAENPEYFRAVFQSLNRSLSGDVAIAASSTANPPIGGAEFTYTDDSTATLNGDALSVRTNDAGNVEFYAATGEYRGLSFTAKNGFPSSDTFYFGESFSSNLQTVLSAALDSSGTLAAQVSRYEADLQSQQDRLDELDEKAVMLRETYTARFANMESIVTQLKSTGDYMKTMMDAWTAQQSN